MQVKAKFAQLTAKQGKTVAQFELDEACGWALPELVGMAGKQVMLTIDDPQQSIDFDAAEAKGRLLPEEAEAIEERAYREEVEAYQDDADDGDDAEDVAL